MPRNIVGVINAKFRRDAEQFIRTWLVQELTSIEKNIFESVLKNVSIDLNETLIVFSYESEQSWFLISNLRIISKKDDKVVFEYYKNMQEISKRFIYGGNSLEVKKNGIDLLEIDKKNGDLFELKVEKRAYGLLIGIISFLILNS